VAADAIEAVIGEGDNSSGATYLLDDIANITRFIDVLRSVMGVNQIIAGLSDFTILVK
jgi:hypothetical protein